MINNVLPQNTLWIIVVKILTKGRHHHRSIEHDMLHKGIMPAMEFITVQVWHNCKIRFQVIIPRRKKGHENDLSQ